MKLEHLSEYLTITVATVFGMGLALYLGVSTGGGGAQIPMLVIGGTIAFMVALVMRANIWILIPICWSLEGRITGTPGAIPVRDLIIIYVFGVFLALKALKVVRTKSNFNWLDYLLIANLLYLITVYIRNPVGTLSMGFDLVGGRPYFEAIFATMAFWVVGHVTINSELAQKMPLLCTYSTIITSIGAFVSDHVPSTAPILGKIYSGMGNFSANALPTSPDIIEIERPSYLLLAGQSILRVLYSIYSPFSTLNPLNVVRFGIALVSMVAILLSGFRSGFVGIGLFFIMSVYFRHGIFALFKISVICAPLLAMVVFAQGNLFNLPYSVQRTLSFLPGKWEYQVISNAQGSTEWRMQIWERVADPRNRYIINWWFGDGFGMTRDQLMESVQSRSDSQENLTLAGDYHSLLLSTIHVVGYVGGGLLAVLMFSMSYYSWKLIRRAERTPFFWYALFVGIPIIVDPVVGLIIFGAYKSQIVTCIFGVALLRLISRSLDVFLEETRPMVKTREFPEVNLNGVSQLIRTS